MNRPNTPYLNIIKTDKEVVYLNVKGYKVLIDIEDLDKISKFRWRVKCKREKNGETRYYVETANRIKKNYRHSLHRYIMDFPRFMIDHANHNGLDNRKSNLRLCIKGTENNQNTFKCRKSTTSIYKGVSFITEYNCWRSCITVNKKYIHIGNFSNERIAALAYDIFANKFFKEFAWLNIPNASPTELEKVNQLIQNQKIVYTSRYRGVSRQNNKWLAGAWKDGHYHYLGYFELEKDAALAYNKKAIELHGTKAKINKIN